MRLNASTPWPKHNCSITNGLVDKAPWLILGAGVGGLTLAVTLARQNIPFCVYERRDVLPQAGAGLLLAPNATRILAILGVYDEAFATGHPNRCWRILNQSGETLREIQIPADYPPALSIHRSDLLAILRSHLPDGSCQFRSAATCVRVLPNDVEVQFEDRPPVSGKALIGAEGMRSVTRRCIFGDRPLLYRGYVGWRGIARCIAAAYGEGLLTETWGSGGRFGIAPVDAHRSYWYASANQIGNCVNRSDDRQAELLRRFGDWHEPVGQMIAATPPEEILVNRIFDGPALPGWSRKRVTLLGDAAHAMTPNLGQGACMAIEDGWVLGSIIGEESDPVRAFDRYQEIRRARVSRIQTQSRMLGWAVQAESPLLTFLRDWTAPRLPERLLTIGMRTIFSGPHVF